jgi:hypothetical protein
MSHAEKGPHLPSKCFPNPPDQKRITMKISSLPIVWLALASAAIANTAPTVVIQSTAMRPGTTLMDVVYRVNDPDDATVKTRALAFVDGTRSFAKVLKPVTFVEGTAAKLGDAIPANVDHTLTWDVGADWNIDLGKVKFEVLAMDQRGLLPFDWITIPAAGGKPAMMISKDAPTDAQVLNALFWRYADGDSGLSLANGVLRGTAASGVFKNVDLVSGVTVKTYGSPFILKRMNLAVAESTEMNHASLEARADLLNTNDWHAVNRAYDGVTIVAEWGGDSGGIPAGRLTGITTISAGNYHKLLLKNDGTVSVWGWSGQGQADIPAGLNGVIAIAAGNAHNLVLKSDGTVVAWGLHEDYYGRVTTIPAGLSGITAIAAGNGYNLALRNNGTVVAWGNNDYGKATIPAGLSGVTAIAASENHSLALKSDGTVVFWGDSGPFEGMNIPAGLSGVIAIAAGENYSLALKSNGTVVQWGSGNAPSGLSGIIAIAAGRYHNLALKSDGTVVAWGNDENGKTTIPTGLNGVTAIAAGDNFSIALKGKAP